MWSTTCMHAWSGSDVHAGLVRQRRASRPGQAATCKQAWSGSDVQAGLVYCCCSDLMLDITLGHQSVIYSDGDHFSDISINFNLDDTVGPCQQRKCCAVTIAQ